MLLHHAALAHRSGAFGGLFLVGTALCKADVSSQRALCSGAVQQARTREPWDSHRQGILVFSYLESDLPFAPSSTTKTSRLDFNKLARKLCCGVGESMVRNDTARHSVVNLWLVGARTILFLFSLTPSAGDDSTVDNKYAQNVLRNHLESLLVVIRCIPWLFCHGGIYSRSHVSWQILNDYFSSRSRELLWHSLGWSRCFRYSTS